MDLASADIWSSSPYLIARTDLGVRNLDRAHSAASLGHIYSASCRMADTLVAHRAVLDRELGADAAQVMAFAALRLQPYLVKAMAVADCCSTQPAIVAMPRVADDPDGRFSGHLLADILGHRDNVECLNVAVPRRFASDVAPSAPSIFTRLRGSTGAALLYRSRRLFDERTGFASKRPTFFVLGENELLKETARQLQSDGYRVVGAPCHGRREQDASETARAADVDQVLPRDIFDHLSLITSADLRDAVFQIFLRLVEQMLREYAQHLSRFRTLFAGERHRVQGVLANVSAPVRLLAMRQAARRADVPVFGFQHGVTDEITALGPARRSIHEARLVDHLFVFNRGAEAAARAAAGDEARVSVVGMPEDYRRAAGSPRSDRTRRTATPPIWYISTTVYAGKFALAHGGMTDWEKYRFEADLVETVLAQVRHGVVYKPYPAQRYLDPDPLLETLEAHPSVRLLRTGIDLRYMVRAARVLITSRPTSTVSWCLTTGRPLVFIDLPDKAPLAPAAREAFRAGTLFFDATEPSFASSLRDLLNSDIRDIEALWRKRANARQALMDRFIDSRGSGAGRLAADAISGGVTQTGAS